MPLKTHFGQAQRVQDETLVNIILLKMKKSYAFFIINEVWKRVSVKIASSPVNSRKFKSTIMDHGFG